jgi:hypothetical protein
MCGEVRRTSFAQNLKETFDIVFSKIVSLFIVCGTYLQSVAPKMVSLFVICDTYGIS